MRKAKWATCRRPKLAYICFFYRLLLIITLSYEKIYCPVLALGFFAVLPSAVADDGKLAVDAPAHVRLPHNHNDNHNIILTLRVNNIQVQEYWQVHSDSSLSLQISNGVLSINEPLTVTQIVATVIVQDLFTKLNQAYENLSVQAVISIEIVYNLLLADAPHLRALVGQTGLLHTFAATGEPTGYSIVAGNDTYFSLDNDGGLSLLASITVGAYTLTVGVSDNENTIQAVATVQIFPALSLSDAPRLSIVVSENAVSLHTFTASGGIGDKTYTVIVAPAQSSYFSLGVTSGVLLAAANAPAGLYTLTVRAADEHNNPIRALATVEIVPFISLSAPSKLYAFKGAANLHTLVAVGGLGVKTYNFVSGNDANHFTLSDGGVLAVLGNAEKREYILVIEVSDSEANKAAITVMVEVFPPGQVFVLGGFNPQYVGAIAASFRTSLVWSSADGNAWVGENDASWNGRAAHQAIVHKGTIYVLGGNAPGHSVGEDDSDSDSSLSDVWSSADGKAWTVETANAWPSRGYHQAVSHHGKMYVLGGLGSGNTRYSDVWSSADGETWIKETANPGWGARYAHQVVSYNGRMYLLGGSESTTAKNDVWSSTDGTTWSLETNNADWTARSHHRAVVHQGKMYVLGGYDGSNYLHDVWSSADGKTWVEEKANAGWAIRVRFAALSFSNALYVLGGDAGLPNYYGDIWSSADGKAWGQIGALPLTLWGHQAIIFPPPLALFGVGEVLTLTARVAKSELHIFTAEYGESEYSYELSPAVGGFAVSDNGVLSADDSIAAGDYTLTVWVTDGVGNRAQTAVKVQVGMSPFVYLSAPSTLYVLEGTAANLHTLVAVDGIGAKSYAIVSGNGDNYFTLSDGGVLAVLGNAEVGEYALVIEVSDSAPAANKATITVMVEVSSQGQFFVLSGFNPRYVELVNEILSLPTDGVWSSADGNAWVGENDASWSGRGAYQAIVHNGIIYVLGGNASDSGSHQSDVWSSADGKAWAEETANAWPSRGYHQAVSHQGKMYVLGGLGSGTTRYSDVWSSADGETWIEEMASVGWEARYAHQVVSYNGRMYLLGGRGSTTTKNDVWSSTDGKTWSLETNNADWTGRYFHMAVVHQGKMYVLGGYDDSNRLHDVWSSADGKTWVEEKANAGWVARSRFAALSFSNTLYVLGGDAGEPNFYDDIWSSADGKAWGQIGALPLTLWGHEAIIFPPPLALFGVGEVLSLTAGVAKSELHTFMSEYGKGEYSYEMSPAAVGFAVSDNGVLSADDSIAAGDYTLTVWVSDEVGNRAQTAVKVQVLAGASSSASLSRWGGAESMMKSESGFYQRQAMRSVETAACKSNRRLQFIVESSLYSHPPHLWGGCEVALANSRGV